MGHKFQEIFISDKVDCPYLYKLKMHLTNIRQFDPSLFCPSPYMSIITMMLFKHYPIKNLFFSLDFSTYISYEQKFDFSEDNKGCTKLNWFKPHRLLDTPTCHKCILCVHPGLNYDQDMYIPFLVNELKNIDVDIIIIHARGDYNVKSNVRNVYHMANQDDLIEIYNYLGGLGYKMVNSVGYSIGGVNLLYYISKFKTGVIHNAMTINSPLDMYACVKYVCPVANHHMMFQQKKKYYECLDYIAEKYTKNCLEGKGLDTSNLDISRENISDLDMSRENIRKKLDNCSSLHDLSDKVSSFIFDLDNMEFRNVYEYYMYCSPTTWLNNDNKTPIVIVSDKTDPISTWHNFDKKRLERISNLILLQTEYGGHLGYVESLRGKNYMQVVVKSWLEALSLMTES
eukprot:Mrub_04123.p1 GENE.Mrub_04123~~Mrub_04123.p1  ORF type:complete len:424 (-),score=37.31 Mrub_04123:56-1252(-)